jgi:hypothetical protein
VCQLGAAPAAAVGITGGDLEQDAGGDPYRRGERVAAALKVGGDPSELADELGAVTHGASVGRSAIHRRKQLRQSEAPRSLIGSARSTTCGGWGA